MLIRQLEYFVALARERHFARAAQRVPRIQPALSEAIRKLEHELKVPLVRRGQKFEGLTPEGERLVHWARRILADCDALKQEVTALQTGLVGELRLGVVPAAATTVALLTDPFCAATRWCGCSWRPTCDRPRSSSRSAGSNWTRASSIRSGRTPRI